MRQRIIDQSRRVQNYFLYSICCILNSPGVTGFDGSLFGSRATQCTPVHHLKMTGTKLAKNTLTSGKVSPYFSMKDFSFAYAVA